LSADTRRPPIWRDVRVLTWALQAAVVAAVIALILWLRKNLSDNDFPLSFDYLDRQAGFPIADSDFRTTQSVSDALKEGVANTGRLIISGVLLATVLGTVIGIARLSQNFIVKTAAQWYVEFVRNIPLVAIFILMFSSVALTMLPNPRDPLDWSPVLVANVRGVAIPWYEASNGRFVILFAVVLVVFFASFTVLTRIHDRTGAALPTLTLSLAIAALVLVGMWFVLDMGLTTPTLMGPRPVDGIKMTPSFFAALGALVIYTSSHIAEIVRGSIQAVSKGQGEAASALALSGVQRLRFVVLPQAMRIALPAMGNQYLNLAKNSSLAAVVAFPEITKVTRLSIAQNSETVSQVILLLGIYLCISLALSLVVNVLNRRLRIVER
jgi:general L-amino acid transport system permease protein